jgi:hypothetical protein
LARPRKGAALPPESAHQLGSKVLTVRGAAPVSTAEYLFAGENGTGHFPGYPLQQGLHVAQRIDNREMILNGLKKTKMDRKQATCLLLA